MGLNVKSRFFFLTVLATLCSKLCFSFLAQSPHHVTSLTQTKALPSVLRRTTTPNTHASTSLRQRIAGTVNMAASVPSNTPKKDLNWPLWFLLPITPYSVRKTLVEEVVPGQIWTFDQLQGILYVVVPIRMTVIKLKEGGLLVYAPVAPTNECIGAVRALEAEHGPVKQIILPTLGLEHKVFAGPFAQKFPKAQVWYTPGQFSFPANLPLSFLGFGFRKISPIPEETADAPWAEDFEHATVGPFVSKDGIGAFAETAFFHKATKTLLTVDVTVKVNEDIPAIVQEDPRALLFHSRDGPLEKVEDSPEVRLKGWKRICQFALYFTPGAIKVLDAGESLKTASASPMKSLGWGGLFPFQWEDSGEKNFRALAGRGAGDVIVAPILQTLILNRASQETLDWADKVAAWNPKRLVACHLANNVPITGKRWREAFWFLEKPQKAAPGMPAPLKEDLAFLQEANEGLTELGTLAEPQDPVEVKSKTASPGFSLKFW